LSKVFCNGFNYSPKTLRAYGDDLAQFLVWVEKNRVDFDIPARGSSALNRGEAHL